MVRIFFFSFIDFSIQYLHALTISLQCIALQRGKFFFRLHGPFLASYYDGYNHLLYDFGQFFGCFLYAQLIHSAIYYLLVYVMTYTTSHLSRNNLPCYFLKLQWGRLRCDYLGDCWYLPAPHETFSISLILMLIIIPFVYVVISFMGNMIGGETHWVDVFFGEEDPHTFCITCSKGSMGGDMATTSKYLFLYKEGH